jgi:hypothetical protein
VEVTDERIPAVTIAVFRALDAPATETPHHEHECAEHDDVCDDVCEDECCIAAAVIPAEGVG